jgi:hypothetical protein
VIEVMHCICRVHPLTVTGGTTDKSIGQRFTVPSHCSSLPSLFLFEYSL